MKEIVVLSTSVESMLAVSALAASLDRLAGRGNWNFDLEDEDHVLRVIGAASAEPFVVLLREHGFAAAELSDEVPGLSGFLETERRVS